MNLNVYFTQLEANNLYPYELSGSYQGVMQFYFLKFSKLWNTKGIFTYIVRLVIWSNWASILFLCHFFLTLLYCSMNCQNMWWWKILFFCKESWMGFHAEFKSATHIQSIFMSHNCNNNPYIFLKTNKDYMVKNNFAFSEVVYIAHPKQCAQ